MKNYHKNFKFFSWITLFSWPNFNEILHGIYVVKYDYVNYRLTGL